MPHPDPPLRKAWRRRHRNVTVRALIVPATSDQRCVVQELPLLSTALSDAIGGGLLDEALRGTIGDAGFTIYLDEGRMHHRLPTNERAAALSTQLGYPDPQWLAALRGDALLVGRDQHQNDEDVPPRLLDVARTLALLGRPRP